ncbi:prolipoprotein diacylglyceryl transferase [Carboxydochorda subterranea]|uniref:Phosphatidylglycerol--prolipoprotein diacylglyceryl transferase n=1 Tax=Carboxydichorda subterranea TaxID=3109565 RepID=A0ABZ1BZK0_9FIRM|nr:prolipoprotein diacylglyceryl transferase [Limnochorda sp. L945t]WRP18169.1 prolipoprotein diacylglyceryl transferase [Limnochorda sp. L945t]
MKPGRGAATVLVALATAAVAWKAVAWVLPIWTGAVPADPVAIRIGPVQVRWYGLLMALAFVPGWALAQPERRRLGLSVDDLIDVVLLGIPLSLLGARLAFVVQNAVYFWQHPVDMLRTWMGGLSIHGALAGAMLTIWVMSRRRGVAPLGLADLAMPSILLGQAIGRWGNFFNNEVFGYPTSVPWRVYIRPEMRPLEWASDAYFHPAFFYESLCDAAGVLFLVWYRRRPDREPGEITALYLATYSAGRFLMEFFRLGEPLALGLTLAQWVSVALALGGTLWWAQLRRRAPRAVVE